MAFVTEFDFVLPKGYIDKQGTLHRSGTMRLATAADEILPLRDPRVQQNPAYLSIILLSRVITRLGDVQAINPAVIEELFSSDLSYLQQLYKRINDDGSAYIEAECPKCEHQFRIEAASAGEA